MSIRSLSAHVRRSRAAPGITVQTGLTVLQYWGNFQCGTVTVLPHSLDYRTGRPRLHQWTLNPQHPDVRKQRKEVYIKRLRALAVFLLFVSQRYPSACTLIFVTSGRSAQQKQWSTIISPFNHSPSTFFKPLAVHFKAQTFDSLSPQHFFDGQMTILLLETKLTKSAATLRHTHCTGGRGRDLSTQKYHSRRRASFWPAVHFWHSLPQLAIQNDLLQFLLFPWWCLLNTDLASFAVQMNSINSSYFRIKRRRKQKRKKLRLGVSDFGLLLFLWQSTSWDFLGHCIRGKWINKRSEKPANVVIPLERRWRFQNRKMKAK